jgi:amidase
VSGIRPDGPAKAALASATRLLVAAGHDTAVRHPIYPTRLGLQTFATWCAGAAADAEGLDRAALNPRTRRHIALGAWAQRHGYVQEAHRVRFRDRCLAWFADQNVDILMTPALASSPPPAVAYASRSWSANMMASLRFAPYAAPWNVAGFPAITVPMGVRPDGLPVAIQLVGPPGSELTLLAVAGQLEQASPWLRHAPGWPIPTKVLTP